MNRAVDKDAINRNLFDGRANVGFTSGFWKQMSGWSEDWVTNFERDYGYDPERAKGASGRGRLPRRLQDQGVR